MKSSSFWCSCHVDMAAYLLLMDGETSPNFVCSVKMPLPTPADPTPLAEGLAWRSPSLSLLNSLLITSEADRCNETRQAPRERLRSCLVPRMMSYQTVQWIYMEFCVLFLSLEMAFLSTIKVHACLQKLTSSSAILIAEVKHSLSTCLCSFSTMFAHWMKTSQIITFTFISTHAMLDAWFHIHTLLMISTCLSFTNWRLTSAYMFYSDSSLNASHY